MAETDGQANEYCEARDGERSCLNRPGNDIPKTMVHTMCPFLFAERAETRRTTGNKREKHQEGAIQKVNKPVWA